MGIPNHRSPPGNVVPKVTEVDQRIGRALRMCSHDALPPSKRVLEIELWVVRHQVPGFPVTLDEEKLQLVERQRENLMGAMKRLRDLSIDGRLYMASTDPSLLLCVDRGGWLLTPLLSPRVATQPTNNQATRTTTTQREAWWQCCIQ